MPDLRLTSTKTDKADIFKTPKIIIYDNYVFIRGKIILKYFQFNIQ